MNVRLFVFYLCIFLIIFLIKKICRKQIVINTIWFSNDGSVHADAVQNLLQLARDIRQSPLRKHYQLLFWTDLQIMDARIKNVFRQHKIICKDYRDVSPQDHDARTALAWIKQLLAIADGNNKVCYVLASDLFRLYLLLKEFPAHHAADYACYIDCNDIHLHQLPHPHALSTLKFIAFHFVTFCYSAFPIFQTLTKCEANPGPLLTNDVIVTANKSDPAFFHELFSQYINNVRNVADTLGFTIRSMKILDDDMVCVIIFITTHMVNTLKVGRQRDEIFLLRLLEAGLEKKEVTLIQDVENFIAFERDYAKGFTCVQRVDAGVGSVVSEEAEYWRGYWYGLFVERFEWLQEI